MEYFKIGKVVGTHGVGGKLVLRHSLGKSTSFEGTTAVFTEESPDRFFPWFLKAAEPKNDEQTYIQLEGIETKEKGQELLKKDIWLDEKDFKRLASGTAAISLLGFHVVDSGRDLGPVLEVIEQPHQTLCKILLREKEAWIPVHDASLERIDRKARKIFVTLPDGLLDVYQ